MQRRLSSLSGQFTDEDSYNRLVARDPLVYEVYEMRRPEVVGELLHGMSIVHPGQVGDEFYMTKGHFHSVRATAEIYYCLQGRGYLLMETEAGDWAAEEFYPGRVVYVPPNWAHRSVNTGKDEALVTFFSYPGNAGHDYATIEERGFRKIIVSKNGGAVILDSPRWLAGNDGR
jgi:glucose-6-phosphate isomerase